MKRLKADLLHQNLVFSDDLICIAQIDCSNLDANCKLNVESVAKSVELTNRLTIKNTEEAILRMKRTGEEEPKKCWWQLRLMIRLQILISIG